MAVETKHIGFETRGNVDIIDITPRVAGAVAETGLEAGVVTVFVPGSTGAVTTIEYEPGVVEDLARAIERLAPQDIEYKHDLRWGDGNGHSHVRAALLGPSLSIPFNKGKLALGTWQQVVFIDLDTRPRKRSLILQITGE